MSRLCEILSIEDQWKTVMAHVKMSPDDQSNKYSSDHVNIIDKHSKQTGKPGMEILLDEWETSGRIRPTVEDLFRLCESLVLFRAYDYILDDLLGGVPAGEPVKKSVKINPIEKQAKELNPQKQAKEFKEQKQITPTGYVNIPVQEKQDQKPIVDFKLGMEMNTDELNKQLDSLLIES